MGMGMDTSAGEVDYAVVGGGFGFFGERCFGGWRCRRRFGGRWGCDGVFDGARVLAVLVGSWLEDDTVELFGGGGDREGREDVANYGACVNTVGMCMCCTHISFG